MNCARIDFVSGQGMKCMYIFPDNQLKYQAPNFYIAFKQLLHVLKQRF